MLRTTIGALCLLMIACSLPMMAQNNTAAAVVPRLVNYTGRVLDEQGKPQPGILGITFSIYKDQYEGSPLWLETQNVTADGKGNYIVQLGATKAEGLPLELFTSVEARWLGVRVNGGEERPRVLLLSVPYALKAADAETVGGFPASAFMLAAAAAAANSTSMVASSAESVTPAVSGTGTTDYLPLWTNSSGALGNSVLFQSGTGSTAKIGLNTTSPTATLDVNGAANVRGALNLPATGTASASAGKNSQPLDFAASVFNSGTATAVAQKFQWQAEAVGNNTASSSGALSLLYGSGTAVPAETGLKIAKNGIITFASGQTFPGVGTGTITGVTAGTALTGGGSSGSVTLNLDTTQVPLLAANNFFTGSDNLFTGTVNFSGLGSFANAAFLKSTFTGTALFQPQAATDAIDAYASGAGKTALVGVETATSLGSYGVWAATYDATGAGVSGINFGTGDQGVGVIGKGNGVGVYGIGTSAPPVGFSTAGVGVQGQGFVAPVGSGLAGGDGVVGYGGDGDAVDSDGSGGVFEAAFRTGPSGDGIVAYQGNGELAGLFEGNVSVTGSLSKSGGSFKIDHPLDPANKYLYHSFVESPDMMNIYNGVATLDANGQAVITMPDWFGALNRDFRYQLTCIGGFAPVYIAEEMANNQFKIGGGEAGMRVSWQVTGIRQDAWANANRIPVEVEKEAKLKGFYIHPELFGAPAEKQIQWARHPQQMRMLQQHRQQTKQKAGAAAPLIHGNAK